MSTQHHAIFAILSDCDKHAVYWKICTSYVIYPDGRGI